MITNSPEGISIVPLILSQDDHTLVERVRKCDGWNVAERLAMELGAELVAEDIIAGAIRNPANIYEYEVFSRPCVFLIFFDEHASMDLFLRNEFRFFQGHVAALPVYCYLPSVGSIPFKIKI